MWLKSAAIVRGIISAQPTYWEMVASVKRLAKLRTLEDEDFASLNVAVFPQ